MAEPFSLVVRMPIGADALRDALRRPVSGAIDPAPWSTLELLLHADDWMLAERIHSQLPGDYLRTIRERARAELGWRFEYDARAQQLTLACLLWAEPPAEIIGGLSTLDGLAAAASGSGFLLVHDFVFARAGTFCALRVGGGRATVCAPAAPEIAGMIRSAEPLVHEMLERAAEHFEVERPRAADELLIDHFPSWI